MVDEKRPNPVGNCGGKPKDQSNEKSLNPMRNWREKPEDRSQCVAHR